MGAKEDAKELEKSLRATNALLKQQVEIRSSIEGVSAQERAGQAENIQLLKEQLAALKTRSDTDEDVLQSIKNQIELTEKLNDELGKQYTARGRIVGEVRKEYLQTKRFMGTQAAIYNYAEKIAHEYRDIARDVGLTREQTRGIGHAFRAALPEVLAMGGEMTDLTNTYTSFMEATGRKRFFDDDDLITINAIGRATKMLPEDVSKMGETFDLMGHNVETMNQTLIDVYDASQKAGLNSTKVLKTLQTNLKSMSTYSFSNGVRGMTEMARQAVKMRIDVSDVLGMADKFYQPEAAIEAAANLQMLGGDIAKAFGDPFETMYLARNKPEELAKKLQDMTENMLQFNEVTGEYELPAEARMQLKSAGDQLGINVDKMVEMSRQASKIKDIKMNIDGNAFDDEVREGIAGMAKMKDGNWVVDFTSPSGEKTEIDINNTEDLRSAVDQGLLDTQKSDTDLFREIALNTQTMSERIQNRGESNRALMTSAIDYHAMYEDALGPAMAEMQMATSKEVSKFAEENATFTKKALESTEYMKGIAKEVKDFITNPNNVPLPPNLKGKGNANTPNGGGGGGGANVPDPTDLNVPAGPLNNFISQNMNVNGNATITLQADPALMALIGKDNANILKEAIKVTAMGDEVVIPGSTNFLNLITWNTTS